MEPEPDRGAIAFAEKLLTMLAEGRFAATYKYAVLLGLMDLCLEHSTRKGAAPQSVTTRQLAEKVLELYWPHTVPFGDLSKPVLRQNAGRQAGVLSEIDRFRSKHALDSSAALVKARSQSPEAYDRLIRAVEWKLVEMPLPRLQLIGKERDPFLYEIRWDEDIKRGEFNDPELFDNLIRFVGAAGDHLIRLSGLLRPLVQREWASFVSRLNPRDVPELSLEQFLFGTDRVSTAALRDPLRELAGGHCFYCDERVRGNFEIDHFIPWSRYPDNGIDNLVVADRRCNGSKRDHLAAPDHVERWVERAVSAGSDLAAIAEDTQWDRHADRSMGVARSIYLRLPSDARLWKLNRQFVPPDPHRLADVFAG
jgi:hypothetical protein